MASTGSIGMTRPMKKVTQVSPRKVSATENSRLWRDRMGPASRAGPIRQRADACRRLRRVTALDAIRTS